MENTYGPFVARVALALALALTAAPVASQAPAAALCAAAPAAAPAGVTHVPIEVTNNHVYVRVCLSPVASAKGDALTRPLDFLLDTGAAATFFDLGTAKSLGAELGQAFTAGGVGAGTVAGAQLRRMPITLAGTTVSVPVASAIDFSGLTTREGRII